MIWYPCTCQSAYSHPAPHRGQPGHGSQGTNLRQLLQCLLSIIGEGADAARQRAHSLTDTAWHLAWHPAARRSFTGTTGLDPSPELCARSVWQRGCKSGAVLQWVMQHWCGVTGWGLRFGSREGGRARKGGSAEVTTETWYPWILAILTYFWVFTLCC